MWEYTEELWRKVPVTVVHQIVSVRAHNPSLWLYYELSFNLFDGNVAPPPSLWLFEWENSHWNALEGRGSLVCLWAKKKVEKSSEWQACAYVVSMCASTENNLMNNNCSKCNAFFKEIRLPIRNKDADSCCLPDVKWNTQVTFKRHLFS